MIYTADPGADIADGRRADGDEPGTRDWTVIASLHATLNEHVRQPHDLRHRPGRLGDARAGRPPTTLARLAAAITTIRELAEGRSVDMGGTPVQIPWVAPGVPELPVWMAGYGPKALDLAGRCADGFILQLADPYLVEWTVKTVRSAAEAAGRDPASITICVAAPAYVGRRSRARPRPVPLVRRDGGQPRRGPGHPLRRGVRGGARRAHRLHQGPRGLRLQPPRPRGQPHHRLRARRGGRPVLPARPAVGAARPARGAARRSAWTSSRSTPMHDAREATIEAYGTVGDPGPLTGELLAPTSHPSGAVRTPPAGCEQTKGVRGGGGPGVGRVR